MLLYGNMGCGESKKGQKKQTFFVPNMIKIQEKIHTLKNGLHGYLLDYTPSLLRVSDPFVKLKETRTGLLQMVRLTITCIILTG